MGGAVNGGDRHETTSPTLGPGLIAAKLDEARRGVISAAQGRGQYQSTR